MPMVAKAWTIGAAPLILLAPANRNIAALRICSVHTMATFTRDDSAFGSLQVCVRVVMILTPCFDAELSIHELLVKKKDRRSALQLREQPLQRARFVRGQCAEQLALRFRLNLAAAGIRLTAGVGQNRQPR